MSHVRVWRVVAAAALVASGIAGIGHAAPATPPVTGVAVYTVAANPSGCNLHVFGVGEGEARMFGITEGNHALLGTELNGYACGATSGTLRLSEFEWGNATMTKWGACLFGGTWKAQRLPGSLAVAITITATDVPLCETTPPAVEYSPAPGSIKGTIALVMLNEVPLSASATIGY